MPHPVVAGILPQVGSEDDVGVLVGLEPLVQPPLRVRLLDHAQPAVGQHQVVVRHQVLGVDLEHRLQRFHRLVEAPLQEHHAADRVEHDTVARVGRGGPAQMRKRQVVLTLLLERHAGEVMRLGQVGLER